MVRSMVSFMLWWVAFLGATVSLSKLFEMSRFLTAGGDSSAWLMWAFWLLVLAAPMFYLGFTTYASVKQKGQLGRQWGPYEWLYAKLYPSNQTVLSETNSAGRV